MRCLHQTNAIVLSAFIQYCIENGAKNQTIARVAKEWTFLSKKFTLTVPSIPGSVVSIEGNFMARDFAFCSGKGGQCLARVGKKAFCWTDSYSLEILSDKLDVVIALCTCIVLDQVLHDN